MLQNENPMLPIFKKCNIYLDSMSSPYNLLFEMIRNYQLALNEMSMMTTGQPELELERINIEYLDQQVQTEEEVLDAKNAHRVYQMKSLDLMQKINEFKIENVEKLQHDSNKMQSNVSNISNGFVNYSRQMDSFELKLREMEDNLLKLHNCNNENKRLKSELISMGIQQAEDVSRIKELESVVEDLQHRLKDANEESSHYHSKFNAIEAKYSTVKQNSTDGFNNLVSTMNIMQSAIDQYKNGFSKINVALQRLRIPATTEFVSRTSDSDTVDRVLSTIDHISVHINNLSNFNSPQKNKTNDNHTDLVQMQQKYTKMKYHVELVMQFSRQIISTLNLKEPHILKLKNKLQDFEKQSRLIES
eukprot:NODE_815_length_3982_cov_0.697141.p2 type:complete len:360 gc:universal NODE_815_length_3982_cov_0.697141:1296-2375(+)